MHTSSFRNQLAGIIGNFLDHYDSALFGLLAPFMAPLFFPDNDPMTALILTYSLLPLGFITRPLGSLFFGWIGDTFGRRQALFCSLIGMATVTMSIAFLPVYKDIGFWAPLLLAIARLLQSFFAADEVTGGAIFVLEHTPPPKRGFASSCYDASTVGGILFASALVTTFSAHDFMHFGWRLLFLFGGGTALVGIFLRLLAQNPTQSITCHNKRAPVWQIFKHYRGALLAIIIASGFGHTTYHLAFTLMNGYIPLITSLSKTDVMEMNTYLLLIDLCLLPCFGYLSTKWGKERMMLIGATGAICSAIPLFTMLEGAPLGTALFVRSAIMLFGIAFAAPYYAWAMEQVPAQHRCLLLAFGGAIGTQCIGMPTSAICLWLYKTGGWSGLPGIYLMVAGAWAGWVVLRSLHKQVPIEVE
jgi:MFS family permease